MSDSQDPAGTPFDSFAGRLGKLSKTPRTPGESTKQPPAPSEGLTPSDAVADFDSFSGRLGKHLTQAESEADQPADADAAREAPPESAEPVGGGAHVVQQGECISSIAEKAGHFWETLWDDPANGALRAARQDPNVLLPNDRVHVPPLREKWESRPTEMRHRFRRRGWPEMLRFRVLRDDEPRRNEPYTLVVDGREITGVTDANGNLSQPIAPDARRAILRVGAEPDVDRFEFTLGAIDPIEAISGVQGRLKNLGFDVGAIDGVWGARSAAALRQYQVQRGLKGSGRPDEVTRQKLKEDYGS